MPINVGELMLPGWRQGFEDVEVLEETISDFQKIGFYRTRSHGVLMLLDDMVMLTERDEHVYHEMITHVPMFSHPNPKRILIIGGGDLGTLREVVRHPGVEEVHVCEIDGLVIDSSRRHLSWAEKAFHHPKAKVIVDDGFKFLAQEDRRGRYDVILVDSTDALDIEGNALAVSLFGPDFFALLKGALAPGGVVVSQCESVHYHVDFIAEVAQSLRGAFHNVSHYMAGVPVYPSGLWCFYFASDVVDPIRDFRESAATAFCEQQTLHYYTPELSRAAFALPADLKRALEAD